MTTHKWFKNVNSKVLPAETNMEINFSFFCACTRRVEKDLNPKRKEFCYILSQTMWLYTLMRFILNNHFMKYLFPLQPRVEFAFYLPLSLYEQQYSQCSNDQSFFQLTLFRHTLQCCDHIGSCSLELGDFWPPKLLRRTGGYCFSYHLVPGGMAPMCVR